MKKSKLKLNTETLRNLTPPEEPSQQNKMVSSRCKGCTVYCETV